MASKLLVVDRSGSFTANFTWDIVIYAIAVIVHVDFSVPLH